MQNYLLYLPVRSKYREVRLRYPHWLVTFYCHMPRFGKSTGQGGVKRYMAQADLRTAHKKRTSQAGAHA
jgi:hypothetical protein